MSNFNQHDLDSLGASASRAAAYRDACDEVAKDVRLAPAYYLACGNLLKQIFSLLDANKDVYKRQAFYRAFVEWTGMAPVHYRRKWAEKKLGE